MQVLSRPGCSSCLVKQSTSVKHVGIRSSLRRGGSVTVAFKKGREAAPSKSKNKQRTILPPNAPRTEKENKESVVIFVGIAALFLSGVLFLFPALLGGAPATTKPMMKSINKAIGTEKYMVPESDIKEGPGPAAAPGTAATMQ